MSENVHERARELITLAENLSAEQQVWLLAHLRECADCRAYDSAASRAVRALKGHALQTDLALLRATKMRVRARALELRQERERTWLVVQACLFVGFSTAITSVLFWRAFQWMNLWAGVPNLVWETALPVFLITPVLIAATVLMARGTHWAGHPEDSFKTEG